MERGVKVLIRIMLVASLLGIAVILIRSEYRETAKAMFRGDVEASPIWRSNAGYYTDVGFQRDEHEPSK